MPQTPNLRQNFWIIWRLFATFSHIAKCFCTKINMYKLKLYIVTNKYFSVLSKVRVKNDFYMYFYGMKHIRKTIAFKLCCYLSWFICWLASARLSSSHSWFTHSLRWKWQAGAEVIWRFNGAKCPGRFLSHIPSAYDGMS